MNPTENQRKIDEICMEWLDTSEDTVSAPMRFRLKQIIGEQKLQISAKDSMIAQQKLSLEWRGEELDKANRLVDGLKNALYAECRGIACESEGCYVGYRSCSGCEARAKAAYGPGWGEDQQSQKRICDPVTGHHWRGISVQPDGSDRECVKCGEKRTSE